MVGRRRFSDWFISLRRISTIVDSARSSIVFFLIRFFYCRLQCLIYVSDVIDKSGPSLADKFFEEVGEKRPLLEALLRCCIFDEQTIKSLEG